MPSHSKKVSSEVGWADFVGWCRGGTTKTHHFGGDFTNDRSPSLRDMVGPNGESNGPFMHDGSQDTLAAVVDHYNNIPVPTDAAARAEFLETIDPLLLDETGNVEPLGLDQTQRAQLIAFLRTLSGTSIYTDSKYSDPF